MEKHVRAGTVLGMLAAAFLGGAVSNLALRAMPEARAQAEPKVAPLRLQISGYGTATPSGEVKRGVFVLDTWTGDVFHAEQFTGFSKFGKLEPKD